MPKTAKIGLVGVLTLTVGVFQHASAQRVAPTPDLQSVCTLPGSQWNPVCNSQQTIGGQQERGGRQDLSGRSENRPHFNVGPIGPVERATLPPSSDSIIALIPNSSRQTALPPMWVRVCRTNNANGGGSMWVSADGEMARMAYPRCVYTAFGDRVTIGTTAGDEATVEYQLLGRN